MLIENINNRYKIMFSPDADIQYYSSIKPKEKEKYTKIELPTDESYTLVCDGAGITCSNHITIASSPTNYYSPNSPMTEMPLTYTGFILQVLKPQARFMGLEPMASELDHYPENFILAHKSIKCKKTGEKCKIKPQVWKNTSNKIYFNGYAALVTEKSTIKCLEDESAEIIIITNGQDISSAEVLRTKFFNSIGERPNHSYLGKMTWGSLKISGGASQVTIGTGLCLTIAGCVLSWSLIINGGITIVDGARDFTSGVATFFSDENIDTQKVMLDNTVGKVFTPETADSANNFIDNTYKVNGYVSMILTPVKVQYNVALSESIAPGAQNVINKTGYARIVNNAAAQQNWGQYDKLISNAPKPEIIGSDLSYLTLTGIAEDQVNTFMESSTKTMETLTSQERFDLVLQRENDWYINIISGN